MRSMAESQESDLFPEDHMDILLAEPEVGELVDSIADWSAVSVPEIHQSNPTCELPARSEWPGQHFFDAKVDFSGSHKKHYVLSHKLNKLFVDLGKVVPFQIKWDGTPGLKVRALMAFTQADHMRLPVKRCVTHRDKDNPTNSKYEHPEHVLASDNDDAVYEVDEVTQRHSIVIPLYLQQGSDHTLVNLKFMCKTSCTGGLSSLNRSPTDVIFTLEDAGRLVLGRQRISVKICSCPKRDKEKEEGHSCDNKRKCKVNKKDEKPVENPDTKKIKLEHDPYAYPVSFMVTAASPEAAAMAKEYLFRWNQCKQVEYSNEGILAPPLINIVENVALLPQPYI